VETSTLTLSRVMMPCDWIGIVAISSENRCSTSTNGMISRNPGAHSPTTQAKQHDDDHNNCDGENLRASLRLIGQRRRS
jgi:hypothetical protein